MNDDEMKPLGGSLAVTMTRADDILDAWIEHAQNMHANGPELVAMLALQEVPEKQTVFTVLLATAILRLAP